jgi:hypothetical protein
MRTIEQIDKDIYEIYFEKENLFHKAYFDSGHPLHEQAVNKMESLAKEKVGDDPLPAEIMPIVSNVNDIILSKEGGKP